MSSRLLVTEIFKKLVVEEDTIVLAIRPSLERLCCISHTHTHTLSLSLSLSHTHTHTRTSHTHTHTHTHMLTHTHTHTHTHTCKLTHTHTHTHTCKLTHTHTHTHTFPSLVALVTVHLLNTSSATSGIFLMSFRRGVVIPPQTASVVLRSADSHLGLLMIARATGLCIWLGEGRSVCECMSVYTMYMYMYTCLCVHVHECVHACMSTHINLQCNTKT